MGCNESKQNAVATGNTTLRRKQSDNGSSKNSKDIKTVQETAINNNDANNSNNNAASLELQQQPPADSHVDDALVPVKDMVNENCEALKDDPKEIDEGNNQGVNNSNNNNGGDHSGEERFVCRDSPRHFYSSRKDHEDLGIDGIISEGRSGKSEYCTPRHGAGHHKPINLLAEDHDDGNNNNNALLEKKPLQNVPAKDAEEENADAVPEPVNVETNLVEEGGRTAKTNVDDNVSGPAGNDQQEKKSDDGVGDDHLNVEVEEKHVDDSSNTDLKTT